MYVAMEFVAGATLRGWLDTTPRKWSEIRKVFIQAGRGLAAAHHAGLVHRDFKPENVLVGTDKRVRVADFGLVYPIDETGDLTVDGDDTGRQAAAVALRAARVTQRGRVVGTPAYMSPEQWLGGEITASSDQFSFCVALFQACYGSLPFGGVTALEISGNVLAGKVVQPPRTTRIPTRIYGILVRGLARKPKDRWPSMKELLAAIAAKPRQRRTLIAAGIVAMMGLTGLSYAAVSAAEREVQICAGEDALEAAWGDPRRRALQARMLNSGTPDAEEIWQRVDTRLDTYAQQWGQLRAAACESHRQGIESDSLFDRRIRCLDDRYDNLTAAVDLLVEGKANTGAFSLVAGLAPLSACADLEVLEAAIPPPTNPEVARRVETLTHLLTQIQAYENAGEYGEAQAIAAPVDALLEDLNYPPIAAKVMVRRGSLEMVLGETMRAEKNLYESLWIALDVGDDATACEALGKWIFVVGAIHGRMKEALAHERLALVLAGKPGNVNSCSHTIYNNLGTVTHRSGDSNRAQMLYERALAAARKSSQLDYAATLNNLGLIYIGEERYSDALPFFRDAVEIYEATIGERHPYLAATLTNGAEAKMGARDWSGARADYLRALEIFRESLGPTHPRLGYPHLGLAKIASAQAETLFLRRHLRFAIDLWQADGPPSELAEAFELYATVQAGENERIGMHASLRQSILLRADANTDRLATHRAVNTLLDAIELDGFLADDRELLQDFLSEQQPAECYESEHNSSEMIASSEKLLVRLESALNIS